MSAVSTLAEALSVTLQDSPNYRATLAAVSGLQISGYTLLEELEQGVSSRVYRGYRRVDRAPMLARVLTEAYPGPAQLTRLRHAHTLTRALACEGLLVPESLEVHGRGLSLIWPDPGGQTLRSLLEAGPVPPLRAIEIAASLARTLARLHAQQVIHKDLRPEHVLVDPHTGETHLFGFGLAGRLSRERASLPPDADHRSLLYISPELSGRMNRQVDRRSDLYSLGVMLYELLCGSVPFDASDALELLYCHLVRPPPPLLERVEGLAPVISEIVARLLAKTAEERYQHAEALVEDLDACVTALRAGTLERFELGRGDRRGALDIPQRLYGRERELEQLMRAWTRVNAGARELLLVRGYSGVGKSVLVHELHRELTGARGYFVSGKFDQLGRAVPYAPLISALRELVHQLLTEPAEELDEIRRALLATLGEGAGVLIELIPDLERILGPQPPPIELGASAARSRLSATLQRFVRVGCGRGRPLVVFLDDLQWAELASLELLSALLEGGSEGQLLVVGAYRSNEVDADHPLTACLRELGQRVELSTLDLGPLAGGDVLRFVCDALGMEVDAVAPLARVLHEKTEGNPFFLIQLLVALYDEGLLRYESAARAYAWTLAEVRALAATDNVVDFMAQRLSLLDASVLELVELAACIGHRFELGVLALVAQRSPAALAQRLWPALEEGLLVALDAEFNYLRDAGPGDPSESESENESERVATLELCFAHDRIQQAAYGLLDSQARAELHLRIGQLLRARSEDASALEGNFELVAHLNLGRALIHADAERLELAQLNLAAGQRAQSAAAFELGATCFSTGIELLGPAPFTRERGLALALHAGDAELRLVLGEHERAELRIASLLEVGQAPSERAQALDLRVVSCAAQGRSSAAVEAGLEGLRLLGFEIPADDAARQQAYASVLDEVLAMLEARGVEALTGEPGEALPLARRVMTLARHTALSAFGVATSLGYWLSALAAHHSLRHGLCDESAAAYGLLGAVVASTTKRFAEAHRLVSLALAVHERRGAAIHEASMLGFYFVTVSHYTMHWRELLPYLERARLAGAEAGEQMFHAYSCSHWVLTRSILGDPLDEVRADVERMHAQMERSGQASAAATQLVTRQLIACLEGRSEGPTSLSDARCDEGELLAHLERARMSFALHWYRTAKGMLAYLAQDYAGAVELLEPTLDMIPIAYTPEARYFTALAILALEQAPAPDSTRAATLARCRADLEVWAAACPANYAHRHAFIEAEFARREGQLEQPMALYDRALDLASEHDWPRDLALINERAAGFYLARGRRRIARTYMSDAAYAYVRWGASAHLRRLAARFPDLVPLEAQLGSARSAAREQVADEVDMLAFARNLQSISREVLVDNVVEQMMQLVLHSAGAERGVLLLEREGDWELFARVEAESPRVSFALGEALEHATDLPTSIVRYTARLVESVVLDDASADDRFAADPYIARARPRSVACLAMAQQGRCKGVLYLENNATSAAFTSHRLELLELLASQALISLDNARLFDALREREAQWRALVTSAPDLIMVVDREHRIEAINKAPQGHSLEQLRGTPFEELLTPETRELARAALDQAFAQEPTAAFDASMPRPGSRLSRVLRTRLGPVLREGVVERVTLISSDVTDQRALEDQLRRTQRLQALGTLAGGVAHDFNNLLAVIIGAAELGELFVGDDPRVRGVLTEIIEAAERGGTLTRQLLSFGRRHTLEPVRVDLGELVNNAALLLSRALGKNVELEVHRPALSCPVLLDGGQFERVLVNLAVNARDAMPRGGTLTLALRPEPESALAILEVRDTGTGMDEDLIERIFDPFFTTKEEGKGTGLGLATALSVVEQSGGRMTVNSAPGRGSSFRIEFPLLDPSAP